MIVCQQMVQKGTSPSVALLRAKAPFKASVTEAIEAIKHFNAANGASDPASVNGKEVETIASLSKRVALLEQQMAVLHLLSRPKHLIKSLTPLTLSATFIGNDYMPCFFSTA